MNQRTLIILLVTILLAVVVASAAVVALLPSTPAPSATSTPTAVPMTESTASPASNNLPTGVLERSDYKALDQKLIDQGAIPVPPPQGVGKPNPFS